MNQDQTLLEMRTFSGEKITEMDLKAAFVDLAHRGICSAEAVGHFRLLTPTTIALAMATKTDIGLVERLALWHLLKQRAERDGVDFRSSQAIEALRLDMGVNKFTESPTALGVRISR